MSNTLTLKQINKRVAEKGDFICIGRIRKILIIKCNNCGTEFEKSNHVLYAKDEKIRCPHCNPWLNKDKKEIEKAKALKKQIERNKELEKIHKRNKVLMKIYTANWYSLYVAIIKNICAGEANYKMGINEYKKGGILIDKTNNTRKANGKAKTTCNENWNYIYTKGNCKLRNSYKTTLHTRLS